MMDSKIKKTCPNCSQLYQVNLSSKSKWNIPLFLSCGHSMCENCVRNIVKFSEPIECKICHRDMEVKASDAPLLAIDSKLLYTWFPVNVFMLGELTLELNMQNNQPTNPEEAYINLKAVLENVECKKGICQECHCPTTKMCLQCATKLCEPCFNKTHKNFIIFKNHVLKNIELSLNTINCKVHKEKPLDYYCKDCSKSICMDCMMVGGEKSCKNHEVVSLSEVNEGFLEQIMNLAPKLDETFRRLTKTGVEVGNLLNNIENETETCELTKVILDVEQHFSKLMSIVQRHKDEVIDIITKLKSSEKDSLYKAKRDITESIKKSKTLLDIVNIATDSDKRKQINLSLLLEDVKEMANTPWYLNKDKNTEHPLKVAVNEDICTLISDYIQLEGNAKSSYKLQSTSELGEGFELPPAPPAPVFPPELPKDVRQLKQTQRAVPSEDTSKKIKQTGFSRSAPKYRTKNGSNSSLNSIGSESSVQTTNTNFSEPFYKPVVQHVQPFPESQHPRPLLEGSQEIIYITHIVDPHNFYVQRACYQKLVKDMVREFRNATALPQPSSHHIAEGKLYLAYNNVDKMWQRSRVLSIDRSNVNEPVLYVFCIDFGSTESVPLKKIRLLPPARVQSPPPLAIHCALHNVRPVAGSWTNDDALLLQNIINNKQAVITIRHIRSTPNNGVTYEVDVTTLEDGVSIAHALVFHECAILNNPSLRMQKEVSLMEQPKLFYNSSDYGMNSVEQVYITHIVSPDQFFVRKCHHQSTFEKLNEELQQEYCLATTSGTIYLPTIGMPCVVNTEKYLTEDEVWSAGTWARGVVVALPGRGRVRVRLADSGRDLLVHTAALRHIAPKFTTHSALAKECYLAGVTPSNKKWSKASVNLLENFQERALELKVEETKTSNHGAIGVTLYDKTDEENIICINQEMIKYKFAVIVGMFKCNKNPVEEQVRTNKYPLDEPVIRPKRKVNQIKILKKTDQEPNSETNEKQLQAKDKGPLRLEVKVLQYQSPSLFYVSVVHQQKTFNELFDNIQKYYSNTKTGGKENWKEGDRCCTLCIQSQTWRRAVIIELNKDDAKVFYSDFAFVETVPKSSLRELINDFTIGDAVIKCHLCRVIPAVGEEWPSLTKEYFKELLDAYKRIFITKWGDFKNGSIPVEVWVYHTMQGDALEANTSEWRCLNDKIIEQGLGIPDKSYDVKHTEVLKEDQLSFLNLTGSVQDWLQLEPLPMKTLKSTSPKSESDNCSTSDYADLNEKVDNRLEGTSQTVFISDWLPPEPFASKEFTGMPTYVDNNGYIFLHDLSQDDTLELISKALDVRFKKPDPKAKYTKWEVGELCIAMYYLDNKFYRGRVIQVNDETSTCVVHYVDYGNDELCKFVDMRKTIVLHQIPIQAHKCVLDRVQPVNGQWDRNALDYIHKSVVEKKCFVKVTGDPIGDLIPIDLKYDKLWINDHLVEFDMAEFTDGSRAIVRQYKPFKSRIEEVIEVDSGSGPDFIVEEDASESEHNNSKEFFNATQFEGKNWNDLMEEELTKTEFKGTILKYQKFTEKEFLCDITILRDMEILDLSVIRNDDTITKQYEDIFEIIQAEGDKMAPVKEVYENKPCIALFPEDGRWYRASILEFSSQTNKIKVRYVDYGNVEVISLSDAREISEDWTTLPPATVRAKLHNVIVNPKVSLKEVAQEFSRTFLDKGSFLATVIEDHDTFLTVELKNENGDLCYEHLLNNILIFTDPTFDDMD